MLTLVNTNRMAPAIAPVGLDYVAGAVRQAGFDVQLLDLCLAPDPDSALPEYFRDHRPDLVGLTFRNVDDCFWPSAAWFLPDLQQTVKFIRSICDAPIVLGGVGFSIFAEQIVARTAVDFGIRGDGEQALISLLTELKGKRQFHRVPGLIWSEGAKMRVNPPAWPKKLQLPTARQAIDNAAYFRLGGQAGLETKRGCNRQCIYCADPLAKGAFARLRDPAEIAEEVESLLAQGVDVLHLCDSEFNIPAEQALAVCDEFIRRRLAERIRWYTYMAVVPFTVELAEKMARAGCEGINFTADSAAPLMLTTYRQAHSPNDLAQAVRLCRENRITVMLDTLLGGPGETRQTLARTVDFIKQIGPDCAGASLGMRLYPATAAARIISDDGPLESNPGIRRRYDGPVDLLRPTFYISPALGERPAGLVRELIAGDQRFFQPFDEDQPAAQDPDHPEDHNYNRNQALVQAIAEGARGAYWDILRRLRQR